jgi:thioredoxin reductase (NADPH)
LLPLARPPLLLETSLPRVFAAGDARHGSVKRVASAAGGGTTALQLIHEFLQNTRSIRAGVELLWVVAE